MAFLFVIEKLYVAAYREVPIPFYNYYILMLNQYSTHILELVKGEYIEWAFQICIDTIF